ncbi:hypothetical protein K431DRAFT_307512 [Polychaeton citri CBS 116435]|uniref:CAP-Gly domain-containing protein n=1 Tax=Polychaeton citri CBS 116435 TaxID=1314669 RepID=A0A9P4Q266_9PEZI|nr:hypothetical protein K431DRAFT_307512 [Polychaeton citri CBS 116435]
MALQTPRQRGTGLQRPSYGNLNGSSPSAGLNASSSKAMNRTASLQALTGSAGKSRTPTSGDGSMEDLEVGDLVDVPGDMYGIVRFIGTVRGKAGRFVGVELDEGFARKGKNDGDVDGVSYFTTTIPGSGIFLPVHRAAKRGVSLDSFPQTPSSPSLRASTRVLGNSTTPHLPSKFSQTIGPGARPPSPHFKPKRPSLPRPESPLRKNQPDLRPTPAKPFSQSVRGGRPPGLATASPSKTSNFRQSTNTRSVASSRPYSRTGSRAGQRDDDDRGAVGLARSTNGRTGSSGSVPSFSQPLRSPSRLGSAGNSEEVQRLKDLLLERDRRLEEQAASLADMERSVTELSSLLPGDGVTPTSMSRSSAYGEDHDDRNASQLRQMLREKNEKISMLTVEFDQHRADFRSTLDSLEMASTETERVYEEQKRELLQQIDHLQEYGGGGRHPRADDIDVESVADQLKQLEELVAELEEGLEESRRGEAEARGEVEFLRGEVERGRSELKREREKAAAALKAVNGDDAAFTANAKIVEEKDDEIRGLKAIIHSLSGGSPGDAVATVNGAGANGDHATDQANFERLQTSLSESQKDKERLEEEIEKMRRDIAAGAGLSSLPSPTTNGTSNGKHARQDSERTVGRRNSSSPPPLPTMDKYLPSRPRTATLKQAEAPTTVAKDDGGIFCEMCESSEHDTLDCTNLTRHHSRSPERDLDDVERNTADMPRGLNLEKKVSNTSIQAKELAPEEKKVEKDEDKWCALCEKDGHLAFDCPEEQY